MGLRQLSHGLLALLLALAPLQASHGYACDEARDAAMTVGQDASAGVSRETSSAQTCDGEERTCVCGVSCLHQCSTCALGLSFVLGASSHERAAGAWQPFSTKLYLDFILPTDTRPPQILA